MPLRPIIVEGAAAPRALEPPRVVRPTLDRHGPTRSSPSPAAPEHAAAALRDLPIPASRELDTAYAVVQRYLDEGRRFATERPSEPHRSSSATAPLLAPLTQALGQLADSDVARLLTWILGEVMRASRAPQEAAPAVSAPSSYAFEPALQDAVEAASPQVAASQVQPPIEVDPAETQPQRITPPTRGDGTQGRGRKDGRADGRKPSSGKPPLDQASEQKTIEPGGYPEARRPGQSYANLRESSIQQVKSRTR